MADNSDFRQRLIKFIREHDKQYENANLEQRSTTALVMLKTEIEIILRGKQNSDEANNQNYSLG